MASSSGNKKGLKEGKEMWEGLMNYVTETFSKLTTKGLTPKRIPEPTEATYLSLDLFTKKVDTVMAYLRGLVEKDKAMERIDKEMAPSLAALEVLMDAYKTAIKNKQAKVQSPNSTVSFMMSNMISNMLLPVKELEWVHQNEDFWVAFGMRNSHILRNKLMGLFAKKGVSTEGQFGVYLFCNLMKKKDRILAALQERASEVAKHKWMKEAEDFITHNMVTWVTEEKVNSFATIHTPATNPPLSCLCLMLTTPENLRTVDTMMTWQVTGQLNLSKELQAVHKATSKTFWEAIPKSTNPATSKEFEERVKENKKFDEAIYANQEADKYILCTLDSTGAVDDYIPKDTAAGYTLVELEAWCDSFSGMF